MAETETETRPETETAPPPVSETARVGTGDRAPSPGDVRGVESRVSVSVTGTETETRGSAGVEAVHPRWLAITTMTLIAIVTGVAGYLAARGQSDFYIWAGLSDHRHWLAPVQYEAASALFFFLGYSWGRLGRNPWPLWATGAVIGFFSVYTNVWHAGSRAGVALGSATAVALAGTFAEFFMALRRYQLRHPGAQRRPSFIGLALSGFPRLAWRARLISIRYRVTDFGHALDLAESWMAMREAARWAGQGRRLARRAAWWEVATLAGRPRPALPESFTMPQPKVIERLEPVAAPLEPVARREMTPPTPARARTSVKRPVHAPVSPSPVGPQIAAADKEFLDLVKGRDDDLASRLRKDEIYVRRIMAGLPEWATRVERVSRTDVIAHAAVSGGGTTNRVAQLFDALRDRARQEASTSG